MGQRDTTSAPAAGTPSGADTPPDTTTQNGTDAGTDTGTGTGTATETGTGTDSTTETGTDAGTDPRTDAPASRSAVRRVRGVAYRAALRAMFRLRPERIHHLMTGALERLSASPQALAALRSVFAVDDPALVQTVAGVRFPRPLGLAAGFDKDARCVDVWGAFGFGYAEIGTITSLPQPGNPVPRLFRLPEDGALLNRMGFNNDGARSAVDRLLLRRTAVPVGVNIGKSKLTDPAVAAADYHHSARILGEFADYLVINVSSPNTPGLRDLQAVESLRGIIDAVREVSPRPLFVKIAPDLSDEDVDAVTDLAVELGVTGIVATNTTVSREGLSASPGEIAALGAGGISGRPVAARALEVLRRIHRRAGSSLVLVGVGGIETPRQAWERIGAGATLLQGYTGLIYGGPDWIRDIHLGIADQVRRHGLTSVSEAVGRELPWIDD
ncbi:quinone-dependent dihydroorotate dehydrogenase [Corynebacterium bovis]|uniref:Dihydroorotate dehydrogenase (quinone) n=1 Tax=Corynebacterium bovis TaxID=36808 RepID=A0A426Q5U0_9CORY|nr:quinone-dependent dihydroorotate dehydrogenase [Corynebacterium bovis]RRO89479.1 dihydroorotate dehydrogenase (quinone) [Corynebacterium bovis]RRO98450.1 dihydroorotate dehydrogenase (quinone) [Corynebacterium bovis]RRO98973.1 dihydroorotate dehydrogenase (quinone) [Corynebacterium bovis]RRQ02150.1 dihydroorotate dehydrogenase (quinone) [Corynebacterium bovis]RRQ03583.1 dihydroorotate dehydrogenase (quinone) [Corynebacterium bovis]